MARTAFAPLLEKRGTYTGIYIGIDKPGKRGKKMILFYEIKDVNGEVVTEHLWFNATAGFLALRLRRGDLVRFDGRVKIYCRKDGSTDYHLSHPTKISLVHTSNLRA
jgi:hypothetical protein